MEMFLQNSRKNNLQFNLYLLNYIEDKNIFYRPQTNLKPGVISYFSTYKLCYKGFSTDFLN
jgi:hypothetical protein